MSSEQHFSPSTDVLPLAGYPVQCMRTGSLADRLLADHKAGQQRVLFFVNTNFVVQCENLKPALRHPDVILVNDGIGMDIGGMLIHRRRFPENLNGTDFVPYLLKEPLRRGAPSLRVFLLGAGPGIAKRAAGALEAEGIVVAGHRDGFSEMADTDAVIADVNQSAADVVLVAMGNPRQENWILQNRARLNCSTLIGVGALFDFMAGDKPRAPAIVQRLKLEWLYRLSLEPRRLMKRYTVDIVRFLVRCMKAGKECAAYRYQQPGQVD